jgi:hypothetical protein
MSQNGSTAEAPSPISRRLRRLFRFVMFLLTAGWAYPHVCTEDMDLTQIQNEHMREKP